MFAMHNTGHVFRILELVVDVLMNVYSGNLENEFFVEHTYVRV